MKIVVLAGGLSTERNVSLSTGTLVSRTLRGLGHRAVLVDPYYGLEPGLTISESLFDRDALCQAQTAISAEAPDLDEVRALRPAGGQGFFGPGVLALCALADIVFIGLHGQCGEDGRLQAALDLLDIPYTGSGSLGSAIAMDKNLTKRLMSACGVQTPAWQIITYGSDIAGIVSETALPCVVKVKDGGSSIGVNIYEDRAEFAEALTNALTQAGEVLLEQYIAGREFSVGVLGDRCLPPIEIIPKAKFYDYESKYQGTTLEVCPADIDAETDGKLREIALKVHKTLGLGVYSRSDFIVDAAGTAWFLEVNTLPGMTPTSLIPQEAAVAGIPYEQLCEEIIQTSLKLRGRA